MHLDDLSTHAFLIIDNYYKVYQVPNIKKCVHPQAKTSFWDIEQYKEEITDPVNFFFIFETGITWSFGHWTLESAIYLPLFNKLKKIYPTIKLIYNLERDYKSFYLVIPKSFSTRMSSPVRKKSFKIFSCNRSSISY